MRSNDLLVKSVPPDLAIIIVNWRSEHYLNDCLASIISETTDVSYEIVVVDNESESDELAQVLAKVPIVRLLRVKSNVGFARANNLAFHSTTAPYVLFLNPDTLIQGPALSTMLSVLKRSERAGIVGCRLLNEDLTLQTSCVQRYPRVLNQAVSADVLHTHFPDLPLWGLAPLQPSNSPIVVEVVSGACLMIRRELFERVGMFSEDYFMYAEDVDLCYKVARDGWHTYHVSDAVVIHFGGGSSRHRVNTWAVVVQCGAKLHFIRKTRGVVYGRLYLLAMMVSAIVRWSLLAVALLGTSRVRRQRIRQGMIKWRAILCWSFKPDVALRHLIYKPE